MTFIRAGFVAVKKHIMKWCRNWIAGQCNYAMVHLARKLGALGKANESGLMSWPENTRTSCLGCFAGIVVVGSSQKIVPEFSNGVRESANKSTASTASPDYVKIQAAIKSAASAASLRRGRTSSRLDHGFFFVQFFCALAPNKIVKNSQNLGLCQVCC